MTVKKMEVKKKIANMCFMTIDDEVNSNENC